MTLFLILACATQPLPVETSPTEKAPMEKTSLDAQDQTTDGPALDGELLAWLESSKGSIQLPVEVRRSVLGIDGGTVLGANLDLRLDDTRMGIGLADQLGVVCGDEGPCAVWLEGEWGATLPDPTEDALPTFSVQKVIGKVESEPKTVRITR